MICGVFKVKLIKEIKSAKNSADYHYNVKKDILLYKEYEDKKGIFYIMEFESLTFSKECSNIVTLLTNCSTNS